MSISHDALFNHIADANHIIVFNQGSSVALERGDDKFEMILNAFLNTIKNSREMPAFGVSLDDETKKAMQSGTWVEFCFENTKLHNEMPFDSLLINLEPEHTGINLIRKQNGKFDGRCFYLDLTSNLKNFYKIVLDFVA